MKTSNKTVRTNIQMEFFVESLRVSIDSDSCTIWLWNVYDNEFFLTAELVMQQYDEDYKKPVTYHTLELRSDEFDIFDESEYWVDLCDSAEDSYDFTPDKWTEFLEKRPWV